MEIRSTPDPGFPSHTVGQQVVHSHLSHSKTPLLYAPVLAKPDVHPNCLWSCFGEYRPYRVWGTAQPLI